LTGIEVLTQEEALDVKATAERIMQHIQALHEVYEMHKDLTVVICPEQNMRTSIMGMSMWLTEANLKQKYFPGRLVHLHLLHTRRNDGTPDPVPGVITTNSTKAHAVTRLEARFMRGLGSISLAEHFVSTTLNNDKTDTEKTEVLLDYAKKQITSFQTVPPSIENRAKVVTYSGKIIGEKDDAVTSLFPLELGNCEYEKQLLMDYQASRSEDQMRNDDLLFNKSVQGMNKASRRF
jgi:hypothetical protein